MSRIDAKVGDRNKTILADVEPELPLQAVTEAIVNVVCHRDYTSNGSVLVMLFKNRLEIWNPEQLPYGLTIEMLKTKHTSRPANPLLARPMYLYGSIEQVGTGTEMIVAKCIEQGLRSPDFEQDANFVVTFWRNDDNEDEIEKSAKRGSKKQKNSKKLGEKLGENRKEIVNIMQQTPYITIPNIVQKLGISETAVQNNIKKLKQLGIVSRNGSPKGGYWKVMK